MKYQDYIKLRDEFIIEFSPLPKYRLAFSSEIENNPLFAKGRIPANYSGYYLDIEFDFSKDVFSGKRNSREISANQQEILQHVSFIRQRLPSSIQIIEIHPEAKIDHVKEFGKNKIKHFMRMRVMFDDTIHLAIKALRSK